MEKIIYSPILVIMLIILEIIHKNRLTGDFMKLDESKYPMTYKEYEKKSC